MSLDDFEAVLEQLPGLSRAVLHGLGEPLLNPQLPDIIRWLKAANVRTVFNSNAILLTDRMQEELIQAQLDELRVSLDAAVPHVYQRIRGVPLLGHVINNLQGLLSRRQRSGAALPRVSLWCVAMRENLDQLPELVRLAGELAIDEVYVQRLVYFGDGLAVEEQSLYHLLEAREEDLLAECERAAGKIGITFNASGSTRPSESLGTNRPCSRPWQVCHRPWSSTYITVEGDVLPCCFVPFVGRGDPHSFVLGNVFEERLGAIWLGRHYEEFRRRFLSDTPPSCCAGCGVRWSI